MNCDTNYVWKQVHVSDFATPGYIREVRALPSLLSTYICVKRSAVLRARVQ
jgi:hypothetical protein